MTPFFYTIGIKGNPIVMYKKNRESVAALLSVDKVIVDTSNQQYNGSIEQTEYSCGLSKTNMVDGYQIHDYKYSLPIGFSYDSFITEEEFFEKSKHNPDFDVCKAMLANIVIQSSDTVELSGVLKRGDVEHNIPLSELTGGGHRLLAEDFKPSTRGFESSINNTSSRDVLYFYSVPADKGFTAYIDGRETKIYNVNLGMMGIVVPPGKHDLKLDYFTPGLKIGAIISIAALIVIIIMVFRPKSNPMPVTRLCS